MIRVEPVYEDAKLDRKPELVAFEWFASAYPHAAAELDWPKFAAFVRTVAPDVTDDDIREALRETDAPACASCGRQLECLDQHIDDWLMWWCERCRDWTGPDADPPQERG